MDTASFSAFSKVARWEDASEHKASRYLQWASSGGLSYATLNRSAHEVFAVWFNKLPFFLSFLPGKFHFYARLFSISTTCLRGQSSPKITNNLKNNVSPPLLDCHKSVLESSYHGYGFFFTVCVAQISHFTISNSPFSWRRIPQEPTVDSSSTQN